MTKKEQSDLDLELRADKRLLGRLKTLRKHYQSRHNKIMDQRRAHVAQLLGDYPTEREAHEAYCPLPGKIDTKKHTKVE